MFFYAHSYPHPDFRFMSIRARCNSYSLGYLFFRFLLILDAEKVMMETVENELF